MYNAAPSGPAMRQYSGRNTPDLNRFQVPMP
jgi:hypothetical protein